jgi:predicted MFS family arabinose efflux permease
MLVCGVGQGLVAPPLIGTVLQRVEPGDAGAASGVLLTATQVANALGIALLGGAWRAASGHDPRGAFAAGTAGALLLAALAGTGALLLTRRPRSDPAPEQTEPARPPREPARRPA